MNINTLFPSKYVKAADLGGKIVTVTIREMTVENLGHGKEQETKPVLWFTNATKGLVLNRTNAMIIASLYSPETDNWKGKAINLYAARVKAFGSWHDAVRVKEQIPARNVGNPPTPDTLQEPPPLDDEEDLLDVEEGHEGHDSGGDGGRRIDPATGEIMDSSNSGPDDNPFNDDAPAPAPAKPNLLSKAQMTRLQILGSDLYGKDWDEQRHKLVAAVSKGAISSSKELSPDEASVLIRGMEAKLKARQDEARANAATQARAAQAAQPAMAAA